jgi:hypothetical protein
MQPTNLALFWAAVIATAILIYTILDGFDLGVGILFGTTRDKKLREEMIASISPFWDGNETWLVVIGASLFAACPTVYAVFLPAFCTPCPAPADCACLPWCGFRIPWPRVRIWHLGVRILGWFGNCDVRPGGCRRRHDSRHSRFEGPVFRQFLGLSLNRCRCFAG